MFKKISLRAIVACTCCLTMLSSGFSQSIPISPNLYGINAWMPDQIGSTNFNGQLFNLGPMISSSGVKLMRYGGIAADKNPPTTSPNGGQCKKMIDFIRSLGAEPVIQVPCWGQQYTPQQAYDLVYYLNVSPYQLNIKYWSIGNEPDGQYKGTSGNYKAADIAPYMIAFSKKMKSVPDPASGPILIMGPEITSFNPGNESDMIQKLTSDPTLANSSSIIGVDPQTNKPYIDIITFHCYPFSGNQSRQNVIDYPNGGFAANCATLVNTYFAQANSFRPKANALQFAVTEMNVDWNNPGTNDLWNVGAASFLAGQFWADLFSVAMKYSAFSIMPWSVHESGGSGNNTDLGYLGGQNGSVPRSTYYHFQMVQHLTGNYCAGAIASTQNNIKVFGSKDANQVVVMIMNQQQSGSLTYRVRLDKAGISGNEALKMNVDAGIPVEYVGSAPLDNQSSILLFFDTRGNIRQELIYRLNVEAAAGNPPTSVNFTASVNNLNKPEPLLNIIPNPISSKAVLNYRLAENVKKAQVQVTTMNGQVLDTYILGLGSNSLELDCSKYPNGTYFFSLILDGVKMESNKMIIAK